MKKRILSVILAAMAAITFTACSKDTPDTPDTSVTDSPAVTDSVNQGGETTNITSSVPK